MLFHSIIYWKYVFLETNSDSWNSKTCWEQEQMDTDTELLEKPSTNNEILNYDPATLQQDKSDIIHLTRDGSCWLKIEHLPTELAEYGLRCFDEMWQLHPEDRGKVMMHTGQVQSPRWHKSYLNTPKRNPDVRTSYMFSGVRDADINDPLPALFQPFLDYLNSSLKAGQTYNQVVGNWYADLKDYIAPHSDCEIGMIPDAMITTLTLNETDVKVPRCFVVKPKKDALNQNLLYSRVNIPLRHGVIITMGGRTQKLFRHSVPKTVVQTQDVDKLHLSDDVAKRISLSFRQFQSNAVLMKA